MKSILLILGVCALGSWAQADYNYYCEGPNRGTEAIVYANHGVRAKVLGKWQSFQVRPERAGGMLSYVSPALRMTVQVQEANPKIKSFYQGPLVGTVIWKGNSWPVTCFYKSEHDF